MFLFVATVTVISPDAPKPYEVTAAKELGTYLGKCVPSGKVTVGGGRGATALPAVFHVGDTALARAKGLAAVEIDEDRWIIRSFGKDIVLVGGGSRGTLYAVSHFLEDFCDVRWWSDREEDAPVRDSLALPALDVSGKPAFRYRSIHRSRNRAESDPRLAIRRRLNSNGLVPIPAEWGGGMEYGPPDHAHTFDMYLPWSKYGKEHPEWYSLIGGRRIGGQLDGQLCLSNPDLKAAFLGDMRELGADSLAEHEAILGKVRSMGLGLVCLVGEEFGKALRDVPGEGIEKWFPTSADLASWLEGNPVEGMTILVKGSRGIQMETVLPKL